MGTIYYYFSHEANKDNIDNIKETLSKCLADNLNENSLYGEINDMVNAIRWSNKYTKPIDDEICIKVDYLDDTHAVCGYHYGFAPTYYIPEETEKYDTKEDPKTFVGSYKGVFIGGALLLTGFILGKRSNKLRPLKKRERYVEPNFLWRRYPDIPNDTRMAIRDEVFDFIFDFMKANDIHFAKRRK